MDKGLNTESDIHCPPGLLGATVLFWSWHIHAWSLGIVLAILLEAPRWLQVRLKISDVQFVWLSNISSVVLLLTAIAFFTTNLEHSIFLLVEWMPVLLFLMLLAQLFSEARRIPLQAIMASLRRRQAVQSIPATIDLRLPYVFITLISASMIAERDSSFFIASVLLLMWILWSARNKRFSVPVWIVLITISAVFGFLLQNGLSRTQMIIQEIGMEWFADWSDKDLSHKTTAMGQIGRLKLSNKIALRIKSSEHRSRLLQQAFYDRYYSGTWHTNASKFYPVEKAPQSDNWNLIPRKSPDTSWMKLSAYLSDGNGILALPSGTSRIIYGHPGTLQKNQYGSIKIKDAHELLDLQVYFDQNRPDNSKPTPYDLELPEIYQQLIQQTVTDLGLNSVSPVIAAQKLNNYFETHFKYSLIQNEADIQYRPIKHFLTQSRYGHCEYFATAGALILRGAGIPSRYVSGYVMQEYQRRTDTYLVRQRHAHAWVQAYIEGVWVDLDYTPSNWLSLEQAAAPWWERVYDFTSYGYYLFQDWWWSKPRSVWDYILVILGFVLVVYGLKKLRLIKLWHLKNYLIIKKKHAATLPGINSPFYKIIAELEKKARPKHQGETVKQWLSQVIPDELNEREVSSSSPVSMNQLIKWHYQSRYAQCEVPFETFEQAVNNWLKCNK